MTAHLATQSAPLCRGPDPELVRPKWAVPPGACDAHAHVIGDGERYPFVADRVYTPTPASEQQYIAMLDALGLDRGVLVQVSVHGTDNRLMLETLGRHPKRLRGVAVVDTDVTSEDLKHMHALGVRGLRINVATGGGGVGFHALEPLAARIAPLGWHIQLFVLPKQLLEIAPRLGALPVPVAIDHMAVVRAKDGVAHPAFQAMLVLLDSGRCWVKISGAYRISQKHPDYADTLPMAQALVARAPDRLVWGSDWPHVHVAGPMPKTGALLDLLAAWVPDERTRNRILVDNPAALYGF
ncbi:MAG TPA: amidohydrolase family protein [Candidatus Cybelea sp.]|nr:amidohydrolase family protein [Candidatus Cybelea sp.]